MTESTLREALEELVTLKEMKNRIDGMANIDVELLTKEQRVFHLDYMRRKPIAWEAARRALSHTANAEMVPREPELLARKFHETYERLAPSFGYDTRPESRRFESDTPNGKLMIAVCAALLSATPDSRGEGFPYNTRVGAERRRK